MSRLRYIHVAKAGLTPCTIINQINQFMDLVKILQNHKAEVLKYKEDKRKIRKRLEAVRKDCRNHIMEFFSPMVESVGLKLKPIATNYTDYLDLTGSAYVIHYDGRIFKITCDKVLSSNKSCRYQLYLTAQMPKGERSFDDVSASPESIARNFAFWLWT